jgi:hypothetical protein
MSTQQPFPDPRFEERVVVATFTSPWEAELSRARLEADGFAAVLADENLVRLDWFVSCAVGGVKVLVPASEAAAARAVLEQAAELPEIGLATDDDLAAEHCCPACGSANLAFERFSRGGFVGSLLLLGFPLPIPKPRWRCGRCGEVWREVELDGPAG